MFSSNDTPPEEFQLAARLGATINLDDFTHIDFLKGTIGAIPETISCRYNPGGTFSIGASEEGFQVMDTPGDAKYGFTRAQLTEGFRKLRLWAPSISASTPFWPPTPSPTPIIPHWRVSSSRRR